MPGEAIAAYRAAVLKSESAWSDLLYQATNGLSASINAARRHFETSVIQESKTLEALWEHIHMIDCCP